MMIGRHERTLYSELFIALAKIIEQVSINRATVIAQLVHFRIKTAIMKLDNKNNRR